MQKILIYGAVSYTHLRAHETQRQMCIRDSFCPCRKGKKMIIT